MMLNCVDPTFLYQNILRVCQYRAALAFLIPITIHPLKLVLCWMLFEDGPV